MGVSRGKTKIEDIQNKFQDIIKEFEFPIQVTWPRHYKTFLCSTQLSTKFQLLIKTKIPTNKEVPCFKFLRCCIYHADKC